MLTSRSSLDYASSLSSSLAPSTSVPSTSEATAPRLHPVISLSTSSTTTSQKSRARRSLSLLGKLPTDFSTILRSHSTSRRSSSLVQSNQPAKVLLSDYAPVTEMYTSPDDERPTRKSKSENRFYNFLTRSRSRSRSKRATTTEEIAGAMPELTHDSDQDPQSRNSSWSSRGRDRHKHMSSNSFKPPNIIQSRPLSSTTTATNTTVTPPTPKARRHAPSSIPVPSSSSHSGPSQENDIPVTSRPPTPKSPSTARRRLNNIFGFSASRKSSVSSSRGTSPGRSNTSVQSTDVPPVPHNPNTHHGIQGNDHDPTPRTARSRSPIPRTFSPSPLSRNGQSSSDPLSSSVSTTGSKLDNFFKPRLFSSSSARRRAQSPPNISLPQEPTITPLPTPSSSGSSNPPPSPITVSGPTKVSSTRRRGSTSAATAESISTTSSSAHRTTHVHAPQPRSIATLSHGSTDGSTVVGMIPRITHTPPTPSRSGTAPPRLSQRKDSVDSGYRYRPLVIVDEEKERESVDKGKGRDMGLNASTSMGSNITRSASKSKESDYSTTSGSKLNHRHGRHSTGTKPSKTVNIRSTKHGSFDFERPGWGTAGSIMTRSVSGASGSTGHTGRYSNRSGESLRSANGDGDRLDKGRKREMTSKKTEQKSMKPSSADTRKQQNQQRSPPSSSRPLRSETQEDSVPPYSPATGERLTSSLGRSTGKRALGSGIARLVGLTHGPFSFEPPVPSPTFSHASRTSNGGTASEGEGSKGERDKERRRKDKVMGPRIDKSQEKSNMPGRSYVSPNRPVMGGVRPSNRGRSLDLGLGLSWAPSKVREDVLFPAGTFVNGRHHSHSASSRNGVARTTDMLPEERSKVGKEIADIFKSTLDEEGYATFKKYVLQFDAHEIPIEGPSGIITRAQRLLDKRSKLGEDDKQQLINKLVRIILQNA